MDNISKLNIWNSYNRLPYSSATYSGHLIKVTSITYLLIYYVSKPNK